MKKNILKLLEYIIEYSYYLLFFLTPIILTTVNYELFEYNKMMLTYALTVIILGSWIIKSIALKKIIIKKTLFLFFLLLFLVSQIISTVFSIDLYVSLWGYYSRFHGGLASTISYIILFLAFISNFPKEKITKLLIITIISATLVSIYGIAEHFGIDSNYWVQDVKERVFSTLGQPNWLAAYLSILIPITLGIYLISLEKVSEIKKQKFSSLLLLTCSIIMYITLLFTKSKSGFIGFWSVNLIMWLVLFIKYKKNILKILIIINFLFIFFNFFIGVPLSPFNKISLENIINPKKQISSEILLRSNTTPAYDPAFTNSGDIRKIVWKGALEIINNYPVFGTGVETFAFSYYRFRPQEHNLTSEWDFLYNKAHNEYLNYLATSGIVGFGSYLLFISYFIYWCIKKIVESDNFQYIIITSLFCGWLSILVTNFFGFSVVVVAILFFLIPSICILLLDNSKSIDEKNINKQNIENNKINLLIWQKICILLTIALSLFFEFKLIKTWLADYYFAKGNSYVKINDYRSAYYNYLNAVNLNYGIPNYHDDLSYTLAVLARSAYEQNEATLSGKLASQAITESKLTLSKSPSNVNFWKTATKVYYELAVIDNSYLNNAILSLEQAQKLAPTDAKISYNLAILFGRLGKNDLAIDTLEKTVSLKPNYKEAKYALAIFYLENEEKDKAIKELSEIIKNIDPNDKDIQKKLNELETK